MRIEYCNLYLDVDYSFSPGCRGEYDGYQQISPDEPDDVEIEEVSLEGNCIDELLSQEQFREIAERILENLKEEERDARLEAEITREEIRMSR